MKKYYEAYDLRYRQIHARSLTWEEDVPSPIVGQMLEKLGISKTDSILELGCGEGRDAIRLMAQGYSVLAADVSPEAVAFCRRKAPEFADRFLVLDACTGKLKDRFDFLYSVAVLHMLVEDEDRNRFLSFFREYLKQDGFGLILTMGDGEQEFASSPEEAFLLRERIHGGTGKIVQVAATSCRMVSFETLEAELCRNGLRTVEKGITTIEPGFPRILYALVQRDDACADAEESCSSS